MQCPSCGRIADADAAFCKYCGAAVVARKNGLTALAEEETQVLQAVFASDETRRLQAVPGPRMALIEVYGPQGELIDLHELPVTGTISVGRGSDQMIRLPDLTVSRHHAQILAEDGKYSVTDMGSLNDTLLNGERVRGQQELFDGARLTIGMHTLVFLYR
jgi:pSer/pThr/pTyr-binding forkhead associated (FHA) protein